METALLTQLLSAASPASAVLMGLPELYKMGLGITQGIQGRKLAKGLVRPQMTVPGSMQDATGLLRLNAMDTRMPGEGMMLDQMLRSQANLGQSVMNASGGSAERLAALVGGQDNANTALQNLGVQGAQMQQQDLAALANQLNSQANVEQNAWEWNKRDKFLTDAQKAEALQDAGRKDIYSATKGLGGALASTMRPPTPTPQVPVGSYNPADAMTTRNPYTGGFTPDATSLPQRPMFEVPSFAPQSEASTIKELNDMSGLWATKTPTKKVGFPQVKYTPFTQVPSIEQGPIFGKDRGY
jgi:hypothetical protein